MITIIMCLILGMNISNSTTPLNFEGIYSFPTTVDAYSVLALRGDQTFTYESGHGDCKVEVTGTWKMNGKRIKFASDEEFTKEYRTKAVKENLIGAASDYESHQDMERYKDDQKLAHSLPIYPDLNEGAWKFKKKGLKLSRKMYGSCFAYKGIHRKVK